MLCTAPCGRAEVLLAWPLDRSFVVPWRCGQVAVQMWAVLWAHGQVLSAIAEPAMFWLDAHYEGGNLGEYDWQCPLMRELRLILTHTYCRHPTTHPPLPSPSTAPLPAPLPALAPLPAQPPTRQNATATTTASWANAHTTQRARLHECTRFPPMQAHRTTVRWIFRSQRSSRVHILLHE